MEGVNKIGNIAFKSLRFLPCFFAFVQYFTVLNADQRNTTIGWIFLIVSVAYFVVALTLLIMNGRK